MPSNLPPGVTNRMIEEAASAFARCETCGEDPANCRCPICPVCEEIGNPYCYDEGHLTYTHDQLIGRAKREVARLEERLYYARVHLNDLVSDKLREESSQ